MLKVKNYFLISLIVLFMVACGSDRETTTQSSLNNNSSDNPKENSPSNERGQGGLIATDEMLVGIPIAEPPASSYGENELPKSYDFSDRMPPVRNQGKQGSCASWAVGYYLKSFHEHLDKGVDYGEGDDYAGVYSPAFLYNSVKTDSCDKGGSYIYKNLERVRNVGIVSWKDMPYNEHECDNKPSNKVIKKANCAKILDYRKVDISKPISPIELQDIKTYLSLDNPLVIGIRVYKGFEHPTKNSDGEFFYKEYNLKGNKGQHVVVIVGYDDDKNAFKVINSWGKDWANDGFLWIDYDVFSKIVYVAYKTEDAQDECEEGSSYLSIDKQSLVFNSKTIEASYKKSFIISNSGSRAFDITDIITPYGYSLSWKKGTIKAGESQTVTVTFYPTEEKSYNGMITIKHNANQGNSTLKLVGAGKSKIKPNLPPKADAGDDITTEEGKSITFDASKSSDSDGHIVGYEWKLGDTLLSSSKSFEKDDLALGLHRVILTVIDNHQLVSTDDLSINIVNNKSLGLPIPQLRLQDTIIQEYDNKKFKKYQLSIINWNEYPVELFMSAPHLPPCGLNKEASRTWVEIYNAENHEYIYGFCGFEIREDLTTIWFSQREGVTSIYVSLIDREENITYRSNNINVGISN